MASSASSFAGPRLGRFDASGKPREMPGHNNVFYIAGVSACPCSVGEHVPAEGVDLDPDE